MSRMKRTLLLLSILLSVLTLLPAQAQDNSTFGLSADDFGLLNSAFQHTGSAGSYQVATTMNLNISGGGVTEAFNLTGNGVVIPGEKPALSATLTGTSSNIFAYPTNFTRDVTLANDTFYSRLTDTSTSTEGTWTNEPADAILHNISQTAKLFFDSSALEKLGLKEFLVFFDALTTTDITPYITIVRQADESGQAHFVATLDFDKLFTSPEFIQNLATQLATSGTEIQDTEINAAGLIVGLLFKGSTLTTDIYIGADNHVQKIAGNLSLPVDSSLINGQGTPSITITMDLEFNLSQFDQPATVTTPDGVVIEAKVSASTPQTVVTSLDTPHEKNLFTGEPLQLQLNGPFDLVYTTAGTETISVYVRSLATNAAELDTTLEVLDPTGKQIAFNDDLTGDTRDAGVENLFLSAPGTYKIKLNTFDLLDGGGVSVELISTNGQDVRNPTGDAILDVPATLDGAHPSSFTFDGQQGQVVTIKVQAINPASPDLDLNFTLYGPDNNELISDDDTGGANGLGERDPALMHFQLPTTGQYRIEVTSWFDTPGDISVRVEPG